MRKELAEMIVKEAGRYVGTLESGSNQGSQVEEFQKAVDGKAQKESWCMCFVQFILGNVRKDSGLTDHLFRSEHCLTVWAKTDKKYRREKPEPGFIVIWRHGDTINGHTGIVVEVIDDKIMKTIEGNTGSGSGVERNGDGVYKKLRFLDPKGEMRIVGYLDPFADL